MYRLIHRTWGTGLGMDPRMEVEVINVSAFPLHLCPLVVLVTQDEELAEVEGNVMVYIMIIKFLLYHGILM